MSRSRRAVNSQSHQAPHVLSQSLPLSSPGVLILSMARQVVYMTPSAKKFLAELNGSTDASREDTALPPAVQQACDELYHNGKLDPAGTDWDNMHVRHLAQTAHGTILIRGFSILERRGVQVGRLLILLETAPAQSSFFEKDEVEDFQFTERQRDIVNGLALGLSNKQIAVNMLISVHTVKEYIRQLMMKLHAESRTGIVARVAGLTPLSPKMSDQYKSKAAPATVQVA